MTTRCRRRGSSRGHSRLPASPTRSSSRCACRPAGAAFALLALVAVGSLGAANRWPVCFRQDTLSLAHAAAVAGALVALGAVNATLGENVTYAPDSRWFLPALFASLFMFYLLSLTVRVASLPDASAWAAGGLAASGGGLPPR